MPMHACQSLLRTTVVWAALFAPGLTFADGPRDNIPTNVRRIPKLGVQVPEKDAARLRSGLEKLSASLSALRATDNDRVQALLPDVEIFYRAVHDALKYQEFFHEREIRSAYRLIEEGLKRAEDLANGRARWTQASGLVVRGYVSRLDGSVQPYGLVVPETLDVNSPHRHRLDVWFHGRGETLSEVNFLTQRMNNAGTFRPDDTIVLHPYGRYSNAFKFAGEVDVLEAIESVQTRYRIDEQRVSVRGFSMGGAACWQFAVHFADRWFAANPGAGFSETPRFLDFFQKETLNPTWHEKKLWRWYDCNLWAGNLAHCPTVAYSGEKDIQKQAADVMAEALDELDLELVHIIGPDTGHRYHPDSRRQVAARLDAISATADGRLPRRVSLTTYTLKYNRMHWVAIDALKEHWEQANVEARLAAPGTITVTSKNVTALTLDIPPGQVPIEVDRPISLNIDGADVGRISVRSDRSWKVQVAQQDGAWKIVGKTESRQSRLVKRHNLQGPIDDALMDSFLFVRPTGSSSREVSSVWVKSELDRAIEHWRRHFRGYARVKDDDKITSDDIASANLILWGDPSSNRVLGRIADQLPISWGEKVIRVGANEFSSDHHAVIMIYPNPLNPDRYVVLNSSFTFREYAYLNNARQVAKLPDWAIVDLRTAPDTLWPGKIVAADFFDEQWQLKKK